ncbi:DUF4296 domain-containing protein [Nonlabens ulvanivorans]|uniref:Uncharacterized protein DUF4296 n=1 Tax=Nonlabens ulvanivorans TaxID=906888 RepID=A0A084JUX1_NONUL|nr:DUF4296 domain-containing protein [Nonlabens ulvanivorans]KEZ92755.1 hypothetical protein IL45_11490 [Nonlabens ulvanivorans]PRX15603.1 uncharacterized protein DUF4296 [Nonlabens ulvanivorans]
MRKLLAILSLLIIGACSGIERTPKPDPFFDTEKMASIMTDVYLIEGSMTSNRKSFVDLGIIPDQYVYQKHGIDSISFKNNFNYYADRVEDFIEVLDLVDKKLLVIKDSVTARQNNINKAVPQLDSISKNKIDKVLESVK